MTTDGLLSQTQMIFWHQKTGNNVQVDGYDKAGDPKSPAYNSKMGFNDGQSPFHFSFHSSFLHETDDMTMTVHFNRPTLGAQTDIFVKHKLPRCTSISFLHFCAPPHRISNMGSYIDIMLYSPIHAQHRLGRLASRARGLIPIPLSCHIHYFYLTPAVIIYIPFLPKF